MCAFVGENGHFGFECNAEHFATHNVFRRAERNTALAHYGFAQHRLAACVTAHTHKCGVVRLGEVVTCGLAYYEARFGLEGYYIAVYVVTTCQAVEIVGRQGDPGTGAEF